MYIKLSKNAIEWQWTITPSIHGDFVSDLQYVYRYAINHFDLVCIDNGNSVTVKLVGKEKGDVSFEESFSK